MKRILTVLTLCLASFGVQAREVSDSEPHIRPYVALKGGVSRLDVDGGDFDLGTFGGAVGVYLRPNVRAEIEALYYEKAEEYTFFSSVERETASVTANVYYDFGQGSIRSYVGAGFGFAFFKDEVSLNTRYWLINTEENGVGATAALHAGVSADVGENAALDIGLRYSYMYKPEGTYIDSYNASAFSALASFRFAF